jgi:hypothetical protein
MMDRYDVHFDNASAKQDELGLWAIWSCYNVDDEPTNWSEVPFPDMVELQYEGPNGLQKRYVTDLTWEGLYKVADELMLASGDLHHQFVELFAPNKGERGVYTLWCGS